MSSEVTANRKRLEASIVALSRKRDAIDAELRVLMSMLKASGPLDRRHPVGVKGRRSPSAVALSMALKGEVTAAALAKATGQTLSAASLMLGKLAAAKTLRRKRRGVYVAGKGA